MFRLKKSEMETKYDPKKVEEGKYEYWLKEGFFTSGDNTKIPYTIVIPPPNVTGKLHIGHACDTTLQDIIIRRKRMQGYDALWLPGMDHAGIATQAKVDAKLKTMGISRYDLGREKFLDVAWSWKKEYAEFIRKQWAALGLSLDYTKERFTLDDGMQDAVAEVFTKLYNEGLIYRGERIINWDVEAKTALSNIEVEYKDVEGAFYHFIYPFVDGEGGLEIATTRPETMFGDTAVMVHPDDERYQKYIGKEVYIPGTTRKIPVISDKYVEIGFGTGVVKVTPAHDPNDFEVGNRHNLERIICMNEDGTMNSLAGKYAGMDRFECRKQLVKDLQDAGLCPSIEKMVHSVGHSERTGVIVEPRLSKQWFVKMEPLARDVLEMQASDEPIEFIPSRFNKTLTTWLDLDTIQDWCISRQLWWGHRIPAWYRGDEVYVGKEKPAGDDWVQDEDVLDTWFSSALWPFATLGWPKDTKELERYFPTDCLVTGYDIIFFWVARMAIQSRHFMGKRPFKKCLIHGLIRDEQGRKMSKSLGNGVDPFDLINQYGCDAMRYFLTTNSTPGQDLRYSDEKMASSWNYINKIWNISRFVKINLEANNYQGEEIDYNNLNSLDKWILAKTDALIKDTDAKYDSFEFGEVARSIYNFTWDDFASKYLEMTKVDFALGDEVHKRNTCAILTKVLVTILKLLHPFMPFVTEEIYSMLPVKETESIMISSYPKVNEELNFDDTIKLMEEIRNFITKSRITKKENNIPKEFKYSLECNNLSAEKIIKNMLKLNNEVQDSEYSKVTIESNTNELNVKLTYYYEVSEEENKKQKDALEKEKMTLESNIARREKLLSNPGYVNNAPKALVEEEKIKLENEKKELAIILEKLK